jgi:hypothetical protein
LFQFFLLILLLMMMRRRSSFFTQPQQYSTHTERPETGPGLEMFINVQTVIYCSLCTLDLPVKRFL